MKLEVDLFEFTGYREFLIAHMRASGRRSGERSRLAQAVGSPASHISQVLAGASHLTLEQAERAARHLQLSGRQQHYFLLLVHLDRAGTPSLRDYYASQLEAIRRERLTVASRTEPGTEIPDSVRTQYYSSWIHLAVHLATAIPGMRTAEAIARFLGAPSSSVQRAIEFLTANGLILPAGQGWKSSTVNLFLGKGTPQLTNHHLNWRAQALQSLQSDHPEDIHYSAAFTIDAATAEELRKRCLALIEGNLPAIRKAPEEDLFALTLDFFRVSGKT